MCACTFRFNVVFAAEIQVILVHFEADEDIIDALVSPRKKQGREGVRVSKDRKYNSGKVNMRYAIYRRCGRCLPIA